MMNKDAKKKEDDNNRVYNENIKTFTLYRSFGHNLYTPRSSVIFKYLSISLSHSKWVNQLNCLKAKKPLNDKDAKKLKVIFSL